MGADDSKHIPTTGVVFTRRIRMRLSKSGRRLLYTVAGRRSRFRIKHNIIIVVFQERLVVRNGRFPILV